MPNTQASALEKLDRRTPLPRIAELLAGNSMPAMHDQPATQPSVLNFTAEIPATASTPSSTSNQQAKLVPLPSPDSLKETVSSAMDEPPVPMPVPTIAPQAETPTSRIPEPIPAPEEKTAPTFDPPILDNKPVETTPNEPTPPSDTSPFVQTPSPFDTGNESIPPPVSDRQETLPGFEEIERQSNDAQLIEALLPVVETSLEKALYAPKTGLHMYLEPMLRATVRRAIAEQMQTMHHFSQISLVDRLAWRFKAFFTSRSYDDIVFERTHRYRVEEVYLLRYQSNSLISYASHDPSRHSTPRKIKYDLSRLVEELQDEDGELRKSFKLPNHNTGVVRCGQNCFLLASIKGPINALVRADLDYVLTQVEQRFGERLRDQGQHFVHVLQPLLEGCLLIQSPPAPH